MRVWRSMTLVLWVIVASLCITIILYNQALQRTVLNVEWVKQELASSTAYDVLRDSTVDSSVQAIIKQKYPENTLIDTALIKPVLAEVLPRSEITKRIEPSLDSIYLWLDSKQPKAIVNVSFEDKRDQLYRSLELAIAKRISAMPDCGDYRYPPEDAILNDQCLPAYVTAGEATQAVMGGIRSSDLPLRFNLDDITPLTTSSAAAIKRIPTYLNYLWVLNLIAIAVLIYLTLLLLLSRRLVGIVAIALSSVIAGAVLLVSQATLSRIALPNLGDFTAPVRSATETITPGLAQTIAVYGAMSLAAGIVVAVTAGYFLWRQRSGLRTTPPKGSQRTTDQ